MTDELSLERIKSEHLGKKQDIDTIMQLFIEYNEINAARITSVSAPLQKV